MTRPFHRRAFLRSTSAAVLASGIAGSESRWSTRSARAADQSKDAAVSQDDVLICDTHQHLWDLSKFRLPWLKGDDVQKINRNFLMSDYLQVVAPHRVVKTLYMEVNVDPAQQAAEAEYVLDLCARPDNPMVGAIIGGSPQSAGFARYLEPYAGNPRVNGVRTVLHDPDRPRGLCLEKVFVENIRRLGEMGKSFDLCMRPGEIGDGAKLGERCPQTTLVIDHCGNMPVQSEDKALREQWMRGMREAAQRPNTYCKISGIIVTARPGAWQPADLEPNISFCLDTFGIDRCFFGGDWPVCTLTAPLADWIAALKSIVRARPRDWQNRLFHDNAVRVYKVQAK